MRVWGWILLVRCDMMLLEGQFLSSRILQSNLYNFQFLFLTYFLFLLSCLLLPLEHARNNHAAVNFMYNFSGQCSCLLIALQITITVLHWLLM